MRSPSTPRDFILLIGLMIFATFNDITKLIV